MSTTARPMVSNAINLGEVAAVIRVLAQRNGGDVGEKLAGIAAEIDVAAGRDTARAGGDSGMPAVSARYLDLKARELRVLAWSDDTRLSTDLLRLARELD